MNGVATVAFLACCFLTLDRHGFIEKMFLLEVKHQYKCYDKCGFKFGETRRDTGPALLPAAAHRSCVHESPNVTYRPKQHVLSDSFPCLTPDSALETSSCLYLHLQARCFFQNSGMLFCQQDGAEELILPRAASGQRLTRVSVGVL